jgi:inorganic pyrophosphatase
METHVNQHLICSFVCPIDLIQLLLSPSLLPLSPSSLSPSPYHFSSLPQTWEDPSVVVPDVGYVGDNDPLDAIEISGTPLGVGEIYIVKPLGILAMIDEGETDWKLLVIRRSHALAEQLNDMNDVYTHMPAIPTLLRWWFRSYKLPDGKPTNAFALNEEIMPRAYAQEVITDVHQHWKQLIKHPKVWVSDQPHE